MIRRWLPICVLFFGAGTSAWADSPPMNQQAMFGGREKNAAMKAADAELVESLKKQGLSREEGAREVVALGWTYFAKRDIETAMKRFNQAWMLDPENGDVYHGFAVISATRGALPAESEKLFMLAVSKPRHDVRAAVDFGRFLWTQGKLDQSLIQLNKALAESPKAFNARSNMAFVYYRKADFAKACEWAKAARGNGDELEQGFLDDMCLRGLPAGGAR